MIDKILLILAAPVNRIEIDVESVEVIASRWSVKPSHGMRGARDRW